MGLRNLGGRPKFNSWLPSGTTAIWSGLSGVAHFAPQQLSKCKTVPRGMTVAFGILLPKKRKDPTHGWLIYRQTRCRTQRNPRLPGPGSTAAEFNRVIIGEENNSITANYSLPPNVEVHPKSTPQVLRQAYSAKRNFIFRDPV